MPFFVVWLPKTYGFLHTLALQLRKGYQALQCDCQKPMGFCIFRFTLPAAKSRYWVQTEKWLSRNDFEPFQFTPELSFRISILAPRYAQTFISKENGSRAMILGRFSLLQSVAPRSQFWLPDMPRPWFQRKMDPAQWFWAVLVYSRA